MKKGLNDTVDYVLWEWTDFSLSENIRLSSDWITVVSHVQCNEECNKELVFVWESKVVSFEKSSSVLEGKSGLDFCSTAVRVEFRFYCEMKMIFFLWKFFQEKYKKLDSWVIFISANILVWKLISNNLCSLIF